MASKDELQAWLNGTPTGGPNSDGRYPLTGKDGETYLVYCPAAQALNPAVTEQPIEVFSQNASTAATAAAASAAAAAASAGSINGHYLPLAGGTLDAGASVNFTDATFGVDVDGGKLRLRGYSGLSFRNVSSSHTYDVLHSGMVGVASGVAGLGEDGKVPTAQLPPLTGDQGPKGEPGDEGPQGPQGPKGDTGDEGPQGPKGDKGDKGDAGDVGPQGPQGPKGDTGTQGIQGLQGLKGDTGSTGAMGPTGPANSLSIGTVTQGVAAATITGTAPAQTLNLVLPKGDQGVKGDTGSTGTRGSKWFTGTGAPGTIAGAISGDQYLNLANGDIYELS